MAAEVTLLLPAMQTVGGVQNRQLAGGLSWLERRRHRGTRCACWLQHNLETCSHAVQY